MELDSGNNADLNYIKSTDRGDTWSTPVNITESSEWSYIADIELDSNENMHIIWTDDRFNPAAQCLVVYSNSTDGSSWLTPVNVSTTNGDCAFIFDLDIDCAVFPVQPLPVFSPRADVHSP